MLSRRAGAACAWLPSVRVNGTGDATWVDGPGA